MFAFMYVNRSACWWTIVQRRRSLCNSGGAEMESGLPLREGRLGSLGGRFSRRPRVG